MVAEDLAESPKLELARSVYPRGEQQKRNESGFQRGAESSRFENREGKLLLCEQLKTLIRRERQRAEGEDRRERGKRPKKIRKQREGWWDFYKGQYSLF